MQIFSKNLDETQKIAREYISFLKGQVNTTKQATIVGLMGDLGSGKTTFSQSIARELGITEQVTSPTFVIEKLYNTRDSQFKQFIHIDAYRLESGQELHVLDFERILAEPTNLIFIEWPEKVEDILPQHIFRIYFTFIDESTRAIRYDTN